MFLVEKRATQEDRKYLGSPVLIPFFFFFFDRYLKIDGRVIGFSCALSADIDEKKWRIKWVEDGGNILIYRARKDVLYV